MFIDLPRLRADPKTAHAAALKRFKRWDGVTKNSARWRAKKTALNASLGASTTSIESTPVILSPPTFTVTGTKVGLTLLIDFDDAFDDRFHRRAEARLRSYRGKGWKIIQL